MKRFLVIANWMQGTAMSGGERIFIELCRRWQARFKIKFLISLDGWLICQREGLAGYAHEIWVKDKLNKCGYLLNYLYRTTGAMLKSLRFNLSEDDIIYSSSDFWPDAFSAFILKMRNKNIRWIAGFYMFAPKPWKRDFPYQGKRYLIGFFYYLTQLVSYFMIKRFADYIFTTNESDAGKFISSKRGEGKVIAIQGGIEIGPSRRYLDSDGVIPIEKRKYDACFVGRFHPQKGVIDLIEIWNLVCQKKRNAALAVIGAGELEVDMRVKIRGLGLENNIDMLGFKDGQEKYEIFKQSRIIVYSSHYGSGGISTYEAMAWGLPALTYDLEHLRTYCPIGRLAAPCFDLEQFRQNIDMILSDRDLYDKLRREAIEMAGAWDWDKRSEKVLKSLNL